MTIKKSGWFITFEGPEGAGKTTILEQVAAKLIQKGYSIVTTREPGGVTIAEQIREVILNPSHTEMDGRTEALLYAAARRQHLVEVVEPAIQEGKVVLCDRFIDSSLAYQGHARGLGIDHVWAINEFAVGKTMPDMTILFDLTPAHGLERIAANKGREQNRLDLEKLPFHEAVYEGYMKVAAMYPERIQKVDASQSVIEVTEEVLSRIETRMESYRK